MIYTQLGQLKMKNILLAMKPCPPGHTLQTTDSKDKCQCKCNTDDQNIVDCLPTESKIILEVSWPLLLSHDQSYKYYYICNLHSQEGIWAHIVNNGSTNSILETYHCPAGYCQCGRTDNTSEVCSSVYFYSNEDLQCVCDRQGNFARM